ncbi:hypothetical protein FRC11_013589, partial [Ceratobasidium sp. 423]
SKPGAWRAFLREIEEISTLFKLPSEPPAPQIGSAATQWLKVLNHLYYHFDSLVPCPTPKKIIDDAMVAWTSLRTRPLARVL